MLGCQVGTPTETQTWRRDFWDHFLMRWVPHFMGGICKSTSIKFQETNLEKIQFLALTVSVKPKTSPIIVQYFNL